MRCRVQGIVRLENSCEVSPRISKMRSVAVLALVLTVASAAVGKVIWSESVLVKLTNVSKHLAIFTVSLHLECFITYREGFEEKKYYFHGIFHGVSLAVGSRGSHNRKRFTLVAVGHHCIIASINFLDKSGNFKQL